MGVSTRLHGGSIMVQSKQQTQAQEANYENVVRDTLSVSAGKSKEIVSSLAASAGLKEKKPQKLLLKFLRSCAPRESLRRTTTEASKSSTHLPVRRNLLRRPRRFANADVVAASPRRKGVPASPRRRGVPADARRQRNPARRPKNAGGGLARRQKSLKGRPAAVVANPKRGYASQKRGPS